MMEILGELSNLCKEQSIDFSNPESFYCIQENRSTIKDRSRSKEDIKIKEGIDLLMKREPKCMNNFFWTCNEFGHFSTRCPKRLRKTRKNLLSDKVEEFRASMERSLETCVNESRLVNEEQVSEETILETIMKSANVRIDEKFKIQERIVDYDSDDDFVTNPRNDEVFLETNNDVKNKV